MDERLRVGEWLWAELHYLFDTDDGSLPEIEIDLPKGDVTARVYAELRRRGRMVSEDPTFWSNSRSEECLVDSVPNAATLVASGEAEPFIVTMEFEEGGVLLPCLGVWVFEDGFCLFYSMGSEWSPSKLQALFQFLAWLVQFEPSATLTWDPLDPPEITRRYQKCWARFIQEAR